MNEIQTLIEQHKYIRSRLIKLLNEMIESGHQETILPYYDFFNRLDPAKLKENPPGSPDKTYREALYLLNWHEASHEGQCRITWNSFKAKL